MTYCKTINATNITAPTTLNEIRRVMPEAQIFKSKYIRGEGHVLHIYDNLTNYIACYFKNSGELHKIPIA